MVAYGQGRDNTGSYGAGRETHMAQTTAMADMQRAIELRKLAKAANSAKAKSDFNLAADRLEERAARKAKKLSRRKPRSSDVNTYMR